MSPQPAPPNTAGGEPADDPFADPIWNALHTSHASLAIMGGGACKYPADVSPFGAVRGTAESMSDLHALMLPGETVYVAGASLPPARGLQAAGEVPCLQMEFPRSLFLPKSAMEDDGQPLAIEALSCAAAAEMVALTELAFPGYFRIGTCRMGRYFGVRNPEGELIAMAGERMVAMPCREVSGVCTHPDWRGRGLAAALMFRVIAEQSALGARSLLHVGTANTKAIALYRRMGFLETREVRLQRLVREA